MDQSDTQTELSSTGVNLLLADARHVAAMLDISERLVRSMDAAGQLPIARKLGRRKLWCVEELAQWCKAGCPERRRWQGIKSSEYN